MFAAIDIGTNTVLLLIAAYDGEKIDVIHEEQRIPRLGKGVDKNRNLADDSISRVIEALREYRQLIESKFPGLEGIIVTATSAVRDSANREEFRSRVKQSTGFEVRILSGEEEAEWTYLGGRSMLPTGIADQAVTLDIGGGSTEVTLGNRDQLLDFHSFDIGSVRFTERFIHSDPPEKQEIDICRDAVREALKARPFKWNGQADAVGVAGTVTSLAYMEAGLSFYQAEKLNGMRMNKSRIYEWVKRISSMTSRELIQQYPEVMKGRADVFVPGIIILEEFLKFYDYHEAVISTGGIRHGAVRKLYEWRG